ncbi:hypothetical protein KR51_00018320 [Rubidibacter lacunae KORDI 51-2]|uniref:Uncharacterized protein n=1 Tax=Rubidibacter lacunae KORDI 51-2 TaxID=582515 RepID=U5DPK2_9CHRO|nr:hypothetical protein KR51_00018320 [Rubidibacter lacunae KORDI 51-2]
MLTVLVSFDIQDWPFFLSNILPFLSSDSLRASGALVSDQHCLTLSAADVMVNAVDFFKFPATPLASKTLGFRSFSSVSVSVEEFF